MNPINPTQSLPYTPLLKTLLPTRSALRDLLLVLSGSLFVALCAQASIPTQPVPITLQTLGVLLVGAALGSRLGFLALVAYLLEGLVFPVFAGGKTWAAVSFTAGYLVAFPLAAFLVGSLVERFGTDRSPWKTLVAMLLANLLIYALGLPWLGYMLAQIGKYTGLQGLLQAGMIPFLVGDLVKAIVAAALLPAAWGLIGRR
jgi:biotin transport system substrate-specific component